MAQKVQSCWQVAYKEVQGGEGREVSRDEVRGDEKCQRELAEMGTSKSNLSPACLKSFYRAF